MDVAVDDPPSPFERRPLQPSTDDADDYRKKQAYHRQPNRCEETVDHAVSIVFVVEEWQVYSRLLIKDAEPIKNEVHTDFSVRRLDWAKPDGFAQPRVYLNLSCMALANGVFSTPHFVSSARMRPVLCQSMIISLISSAKACSPNATAKPHGASSIVFSGIS